MNEWDTVRSALNQTQELDRAVTAHVERVAELLNRNGNIKRVSAYELRKIKRALRDFDMTTGRWRP